MLSLEQCKKILNNNESKFNDEVIESVRDELYVLANLAFKQWKNKSCLTKADESSSPLVSHALTSYQLSTGDLVDVKNKGNVANTDTPEGLIV